MSSESIAKPHPRTPTVLLALSLLLLVFGAKLELIGRYGSDIPFWDQWAKEGELLYEPWFEHGVLWHSLFLPHSEHRMAPTLALNLALAAAEGQWDVRTQCVASALLDSAVAAGLFIWAARRFGSFWTLSLYVLCLLLFGLPLTWDNVLGGFQSQFYFMVGFSLLSMNGLLSYYPLSGRWILGMAAGLGACVSMGSGFLCFAAVAAVCLLRLARGSVGGLRPAATLTAAVAVSCVAWAARAQAPWHEALHAHSARDFLAYCAHCLSWPVPGWWWLAPLYWIPLLWAAARTIRSAEIDREAGFVLACAAWVLLQVAAISYARGAEGGMPANRYGSVLMLGVLGPFLSLPAMGASIGEGRARWAGLLILLVVAGASAYASLSYLRSDIPQRARLLRGSEINVKAYVATGDLRALERPDVPFPDPKWLARILDEPTIRRLLPPSISTDGSVHPIGRLSAGLAANAAYLLLAGVACLLAGAVAGRPRKSLPASSS